MTGIQRNTFHKAVILLGLLALGLLFWLIAADNFMIFRPQVVIDKIVLENDEDGDGINDLDDIVQGARKEVINRTWYRSAYYDDGYPPENEGVCTDVIWRALANAGYDLKALMDADIINQTADYPGVAGKPDPNIDFRRVKNQLVFFSKYAVSLTTEVKPYDIDNLLQWQPGDIVTTGGTEHVAVISDKRRRDGIPYVIHNPGPRPVENDRLMKWRSRITGHFRLGTFPPQN
jgi:uncharacterized protein YijF (DUF1287 family)